MEQNLGHARLPPPTGHVLLRIRSKSIIFMLLPATSPWEIGLECLVKRFCIEFWPNSSLFVPARGVQTNVFLKPGETASTFQHLGPISEINIPTCGQHLGGRSRQHPTSTFRSIQNHICVEPYCRRCYLLTEVCNPKAVVLNLGRAANNCRSAPLILRDPRTKVG